MKMDARNEAANCLHMLGSAVAPSDYITALLLLKNVKEHLHGQIGEVTDDQLYVCLLEAVDKAGVRNPFQNKEQFAFIYRSMDGDHYMNWEELMAYAEAASKKPLVPKALMDVYKERLAINPKTVLVTEAEKFVPNLQPMIEENKNTKFVLITQSRIYSYILERIFKRCNNVEVLVADIYCYGFTNSRFDLIFACPNFGGRMLSDDPNFMCREFEMIALENLLLHLNDGGRLVITMPGRITFASGKISDLRQFIQMTYTIREIGELPEGTISYCGIKVYLLDIENNRPNEDTDIGVRRYSASSKKARRAAVTSLEVTDDTFVMLSELEEQGDWSIDRIFAQQDESYLNYQSSKVRKSAIGDVSEVFRGKAVTRKDPDGNIGVVNISNLGDYEIDYAGLEHLQEEERKVFNYLLREGDVLLPARGTAIRTAVFHAQSYPCIASSNLIVIRPDAKILDSTYLKIFLDSPIGNKLISSAQQGTTVMNISYRDLKVLEVPVPPLDTQKAVAKEYLEELTKYREAIAAAEKRWTETLTKLQTF